MQLKSHTLERCRTEFEAAVTGNFFGISFARDDLGRYIDPRVGNMWWAWLERHQTLNDLNGVTGNE